MLAVISSSSSLPATSTTVLIGEVLQLGNVTELGCHMYMPAGTTLIRRSATERTQAIVQSCHSQMLRQEYKCLLHDAPGLFSTPHFDD